MEGKIYLGVSAEQVPSFEDQIRQIVREEVAAQVKRLDARIELIEKDLLLSKKQMTESVQMISQTIGDELIKVIEEQREAYISAAVHVMSRHIDNI